VRIVEAMRFVLVVSMLWAGSVFAQDVSLEVRAQRVLDAPGVVRISVEDVSVVDVRVLNSGQVWVLGTAVGETTVGLWRANGELTTFKVKVDAPAPRSLRVGGELLVEDDFDQVEATSPAVEVRIIQRGQVVVRAKAPGKATVVLTSRGAPVREVPINVK
jgi:Flp pilus assembly secretin CpaC